MRAARNSGRPTPHTARPAEEMMAVVRLLEQCDAWPRPTMDNNTKPQVGDRWKTRVWNRCIRQWESKSFGNYDVQTRASTRPRVSSLRARSAHHSVVSHAMCVAEMSTRMPSSLVLHEKTWARADTSGVYNSCNAWHTCTSLGGQVD